MKQANGKSYRSLWRSITHCIPTALPLARLDQILDTLNSIIFWTVP